MNDLSSSVLIILWRSSWQLALLGMIIWPLSQLSRRAIPKFAYGLWGILLVKTLLPFSWPITVSSGTFQAGPVDFVSQLPPILINGYGDTTYNLHLFIAGLWLIGVLFFTFRLVINDLQFRKKLEDATPWPVSTWISSLLNEQNIHRPIRIFTSAKVQTPFTVGLIKPRIYLPMAARNWSGSELHSVLAHEIAHIRRYDIVVIYLQAFARTLYFFHPVVWFMNDQLDLERERICDDAAIRLVNANRTEYGRCLLNQLEFSINDQHPPVLASGFFMSRHSLVKRFEYIIQKTTNLKEGLKMYHKLIFSAVVVLALGVSCQTKSATELTAISEDQALKPVSENEVVFVEYDTPPQPVGGYAAIQTNMVYPDDARKAGIQGTVIVQTKISEAGIAGKSKVIKGVPEGGLNEAAIAAVEKTVWKPAIAEDKAVAVWITIPVVFKLQEKQESP